MSVSLTKTPKPGTVVRIKDAGAYEDGIVGFICRTKPTNGDTVFVQVLSAPGDLPFSSLPGTRLSYNDENLEVVPR